MRDRWGVYQVMISNDDIVIIAFNLLFDIAIHSLPVAIYCMDKRV